MAKHDHKVCTHEDVKYCKTCNVCHCLECNQEWVIQSRSYYPYQYPYWWYNGIGQDTAMQTNLNQQSNTNTPVFLGDLQPTTCNHGT